MGLRHAIRSLRQTPGFTLAAVVALALGIDVNTAIFSVADGLVLKPVAVPNADGLVVVLRRTQGTDNQIHLSPAVLRVWSGQKQLFRSASAYSWWSPNLTGAGEPISFNAARVAAGFFATLDAAPMLGRTFAADEHTPGRDGVVILSYPLWQRQFSGSRAVLGRTIHLDDRPYTIVGVMGKNFDFPVSARLWTPLALTPAEAADRSFSSGAFSMVARLRKGVEVQSANAVLETLALNSGRRFPATDRGLDALVVPMARFISGDLNVEFSLLLWLATLCVVLIACANVANLQFARATGRMREVAVRAALGASRGRLIRERLLESVLLALLGAAAALLLADWGVRLIVEHMPAEVEQYVAGWSQIRLDSRALLYTLAVAVGAGLLAGIAPAILASRPNLNAELKTGGRSGVPGAAHHRSRNALLILQTALALVLLTGAGLMGRSVSALLNANRGFAPGGVLSTILQLPTRRYPTLPQTQRFFTEAVARAAALPGAAAAAVVTNVPFGDEGDEATFAIAGERQYVHAENISGGYFAAMRVPLLAGRNFDGRDGPDTAPVAIVSRRFAQEYFPGPDSLHRALGQRIQLHRRNSADSWATIVGVAGDVRYSWIERVNIPAVYRPYLQCPDRSAYLVVRARRGDPLALAPALRTEIHALDPDLPLYETKTLSKVISESVLGLSYVAVLMLVLGAVALALAAVGIFAVMAYIVGERTREIGLRMALGAPRGAVMRMILRRGLAITGIGLVIGLGLAVLLARGLAGLIFGVSALDGMTFAVVAALLFAASLLACYLPARRAARLDPLAALREE